MAITINSTNQIYNPAYNDMVIIVTSTNKAQTNFKYIAELYINGTVITLEASKDFNYQTGVFNFGRIIENYLSSDISKSTYGFQQNTNSYISWYVKFGEQYGSTPVNYTNLATSSTFYSWNSIFDFLQFQSYTQTPYVLSGSAVKQILTNKPATVDIRDSEYAWLYAMTDSSGVIYEARVRTFDASSGVIQSVKVLNPFQSITSANDRFIRFGCGTSNLNLIPSSGITGGSQPLITASVNSYDITFEKFNGTIVSAPQTFTINNVCTRNNSYRFHFLNKLGGFDSFTFFRGSTKTLSIDRSKYKSIASRSTSSTAYGYSTNSRGSNDFNISIKDNVKVQSDWIKESTMSWLEELITSPEVYLDDATYGLIAVNINNSSHELKQDSQELLFNLTIDFNYSFDRTRQRK